MRLWMICYDIADARRRRRVAVMLADAGAQRVQESVFEGWFSRRDLAALYAGLAPIVIDDGGSLRAYPLTAATGGRRSFGTMPSVARPASLWLC